MSDGRFVMLGTGDREQNERLLCDLTKRLSGCRKIDQPTAKAVLDTIMEEIVKNS